MERPSTIWVGTTKSTLPISEATGRIRFKVKSFKTTGKNMAKSA
jgi:hypothetical protein